MNKLLLIMSTLFTFLSTNLFAQNLNIRENNNHKILSVLKEKGVMKEDESSTGSICGEGGGGWGK